jgi:hypothetical protein
MTPFSELPEQQDEVCGAAAMSYRGSAGSAFVAKGRRPTAQMTRTLTHGLRRPDAF